MTTAIACKTMKGQSVSSVSLISFRQCSAIQASGQTHKIQSLAIMIGLTALRRTHVMYYRVTGSGGG